MPDPRHIPTFDHRLQGRCDAPASKSATHRALVLAALSDGVSFIEKPLDAEDSQVTREGLGLLGIRSKIVDDGWEVYGTGGRIPGGANIELRESGTSCRFLTAVAALGQRPSRLDGAPRLRQRPLAALTEALTALGARCESDGGDGLPLRIGGAPLRGRRIALPASPSSQFVSALLMIGGLLPDGLHLTLARPWVSRGYVDMTMEMLESCGADVERSGTVFQVAPGALSPRRWVVEGDYSSASYFLAAGAILGTIQVDGLRQDSHQPDAVLLDVLRQMGCTVDHHDETVRVVSPNRLKAIERDLTDAPDVAPTVAALAIFAEGETRLTGLGHLRVKESDRLHALADNLTRMGVTARVEGDALSIHSRSDRVHGAVIETRGDHRIAMAFAIAGLRIPGVVLDDGDCVAKSYPGFWRALSGLLELE